MAIVANDSITVSNVNDGTITHTAWAYIADGTDRFTTVYPNLNLLDGTKDFSGNWGNLDSNKWITDGTYKGLTVKKRTAQYSGINKIFTAPTGGTYTFSAYVKASGNTTSIYRYGLVNGITQPNKRIGTEFDWLIDSVTVTLQAGQIAHFRYEIATANTDAILWTAGHKWEQGSIATPWMPSTSEVTTADWPSYRGEYSDTSSEQSTNPSNYTWSLMRGSDGKDGNNGTDGTSGIIVSSVAPASPQTGQLWQDTSTTPQLVKKWTGTSWVIWEFYAQNLKSDSLETVSSKIGNIYNDFTLEDGTTGTLHIGNSEYRINSQVPKDNFLFKENIFFDPDGVNFTFEGDSTSNSGYGNYSKSGSDFYLQNNKMASYTVSGIRMSNEFAGYRIQIHDATHKMNFVSEKGQGFDFTGPVSFNGVPMNTTSSVTVALFHNITVDFRRQGNLVIASIGRQVRTTTTTGEDVVIWEKVPSGYRPSYLHYFGINRNLDSNVLTGLVMGFEPNGDVRVTIGAIETAVFSGSTSYFTEDPLP